MKKVVQFSLILIFLFSLSEDIFAQGPPPWAPAHGYRAKTRYVYFPDQNFYYDLNTHNYIYLSGPNWSISASLPKIFVGINLGSSTQIQLDFVGDRPYRYNNEHLVKYKMKHPKKIKKEKIIIREYDDDDEHHDNGHGKGRGRGHGHH